MILIWHFIYLFLQVLAATDADAEEEKVAGEQMNKGSNVSEERRML